MPAARVAVDGDVTPTPGAGIPEVASGGSGIWTPGSVRYETYDDLTVAGKKVTWEAACDFSFAGKNGSGADVTDVETVTLTAASKLLKKGGDSVLVHGDTETSAMGNTLTVSASGLLKTS